MSTHLPWIRARDAETVGRVLLGGWESYERKKWNNEAAEITKKDESFGGLGAWVLNLEAAVAEAALESTASTSLVLAPFAPAMHARGG